MTKFYVIAGEPSGDLHGANLIKALYRKESDLEFRAWGGDMMKGAGAQLVMHYKDLAFMGIVEVVRNIRTIFNNINFCKEDIQAFQPDALILIDYSGFNLRIAEWAKQEGYTVFYYISPQVWAWRSHRVQKIKRYVDRMFVILPFEEEFYRGFDYEVDFVGHPLLDIVKEKKENAQALAIDNPNNKPIIALLPGSRKQEIQRMLDVMLKVTTSFKDYLFVIAGAPSQSPELYKSLMAKVSHINTQIVFNQTYPLLARATAALVTSGTATLETGLFEVPQVVCYKGNRLNYEIVKRVVNIKYISLVNLIMDQALVTELIQHDLTAENLQKELDLILHGPKRKEIEEGYAALKSRLGHQGAADRTAEKILTYLK